MKDRYRLYKENHNELENLTEMVLTNLQKKYLKSNYTRDMGTKVGQMIKNDIIDIQSWVGRRYCNYCSMDRPKTADHYLPKSKFAEFSILPANLIPCCGVCNLDIAVNWIVDGKRTIINFYKDKFIEEKEFLKVDVVVKDYINTFNPDVSVNYYIDCSLLTTKEAFLVRSHFESLELIDQYNDNITGEAEATISGILSNKSDEIRDYYNALKDAYEQHLDKRGLNNYLTSFFKGLLESPSFNEWIKEYLDSL